MRLFCYYALHSFINQIKKIFKTWVMIFILICFVAGVGLGLLFVALDNLSESRQEEMEITQELEQEMQEADLPEDDKPNLIESTVGLAGFIELLAAGVILLAYSLAVMGADKGAGKIFLPADVTLLFPSPMRPQSVMMFRIAMQIGNMLILGIYLLFQLPNLVLNLGLSLGAAIALLAAFCLTMFTGTLLQLLLYLLGSISDTFKRFLRPALYAVLALVAGGFILYQKTTGEDYITAAGNYFNSTSFRLVPLWGWLKAFCRFAAEGDLAGSLLSLGAEIIGIVLLIWIIWKLKVDFYEDAMTKAEEVAEIMERANAESSSTVIIKRKKDRSEKLRRDEFKHGAGANVFFFKAMYNRFRFAHFGFFTKTMETYLVGAALMGCFCRFSLHTDSILYLVAMLAGFVFFRSLGNPLEQDTKMDFFIMIPESTWAKLFYSLMAGLANTALDIFLPLLLGASIIGANPLLALLWIIPILSMDFYSTTIGVFIGLSVPTSAGKTLKQMVQVMFVYFGMVPDIIILAIAFSYEVGFIGIAGVIVFHLLLGGFFFGLSPLFLDAVGKKTAKAGEEIFLS